MRDIQIQLVEKEQVFADCKLKNLPTTLPEICIQKNRNLLYKHASNFYQKLVAAVKYGFDDFFKEFLIQISKNPTQYEKKILSNLIVEFCIFGRLDLISLILEILTEEDSKYLPNFSSLSSLCGTVSLCGNKECVEWWVMSSGKKYSSIIRGWDLVHSCYSGDMELSKSILEFLEKYRPFTINSFLSASLSIALEQNHHDVADMIKNSRLFRILTSREWVAVLFGCFATGDKYWIAFAENIRPTDISNDEINHCLKIGALAGACKSGRARLVLSLLAKIFYGSSVPGEVYSTAIGYAIDFQNNHLVATLLEYAEQNKICLDYDHIMIEACSIGNADIVEQFLDRINLKNYANYFFRACKSGNVQVAKLFAVCKDIEWNSSAMEDVFVSFLKMRGENLEMVKLLYELSDGQIMWDKNLILHLMKEFSGKVIEFLLRAFRLEKCLCTELKKEKILREELQCYHEQLNKRPYFL